jgi:branched-chain amino acid transport system substrate-binding protein
LDIAGARQACRRSRRAGASFPTGQRSWRESVGGAPMKRTVLGILVAGALAASQLASTAHAQSAAGSPPTPNAFFDFKAMGDMSDFDPANPVIPTGDTIKIAIVASFSGPAALVGQIYWASALWAAHDINKRGGIMVDGKKKMVELIKADHMSKPDQAKKITERMVLQEKVNVLWGTDGSNLQKIINETANKYKVISINTASLSDDLQDATNFSRYAFQSSMSADQLGRGIAYYYGNIRKKEKKFYILNQDYSFGHVLADGFKNGLKEYYPTAQLIGEDYHKLFLTDFAPYLEKIKASGAEVVFTGDWIPDAANLLKQARQMGIKLPFAHVFMDEPNFLTEVGVEGTKGLVQISQYASEGDAFKTPEQIKYYKTWNDLWHNKWKTPPFNSPLFEHGTGNIGSYVEQTYWLLSVMARAKSTDPEKIIKVWENDSYRFTNGKVLKMRGCDHKAIQDLHILEFVPPGEQKQSYNIRPYYWNMNYSAAGPIHKIPAKAVLPLMDPKLERCKGKSPAGE